MVTSTSQHQMKVSVAHARALTQSLTPSLTRHDTDATLTHSLHKKRCAAARTSARFQISRCSVVNHTTRYTRTAAPARILFYHCTTLLTPVRLSSLYNAFFLRARAPDQHKNNSHKHTLLQILFAVLACASQVQGAEAAVDTGDLLAGIFGFILGEIWNSGVCVCWVCYVFCVFARVSLHFTSRIRSLQDLSRSRARSLRVAVCPAIAYFNCCALCVICALQTINMRLHSTHKQTTTKLQHTNTPAHNNLGRRVRRDRLLYLLCLVRVCIICALQIIYMRLHTTHKQTNTHTHKQTNTHPHTHTHTQHACFTTQLGSPCAPPSATSHPAGASRREIRGSATPTPTASKSI
jgi:hypothetical protein